MVEKDVLEEKINERKEKFEQKKETVGEKVDSKYNEKKEKFDEKKEKSKVYSEKFVNDLNTTIDEFKDSLKNMQKYADDKINEYKNATISNLAVDLIESDDIYYLKVAVPGLDKDEVEIEAGDNDIVITATFKPFVEELKDAGILKDDEDDESEDVAEAKVIASELTVGKCSKTVRFENSIEVEKITAKYKTGIILITIPKLIIPKHKVTVE